MTDFPPRMKLEESNISLLHIFLLISSKSEREAEAEGPESSCCHWNKWDGSRLSHTSCPTWILQHLRGEDDKASSLLQHPVNTTGCHTTDTHSRVQSAAQNPHMSSQKVLKERAVSPASAQLRQNDLIWTAWTWKTNISPVYLQRDLKRRQMIWNHWNIL